MKFIGQIFILSILKTFTNKLFLTFWLLFPALQSFGQVNEDFDDNDLIENPLWVGHPDHFTVESGTLLLRAPADGSPSYLATTNSLAAEAAWECQLALSFNPSSSNFCRLFLIADQADLNSPLNGYFVQLGSAADDVCLYKQSGTDKVKLIDGRDGLLNNDLNSIRVRVTRSAAGEWQLFTRMDQDEYNLEGTASDSDLPITSHAGIQCVYTPSRADKFSFTHFAIQALGDHEAPFLVQGEVKSPRELEIAFSEPVEKSAMENALNYRLDTNHPSFVRQHATNPAVATLSFATDFDFLKTYDLVVRNIPDLAGNFLVQDTLSFVYRRPGSAAFRDVVITEIMADPTPVIGLPEAEFVEVLNTTSQPVDLSRWIITDGSSKGVLAEESILDPGEFAVLTAASTASAFLDRGHVLAVSNFPSLNNSGDYVILTDEKGRTIDSVYFEASWYQDSDNAGGGWSLEIIDPLNPCSGGRNWSSSEHESGGTPGELNSIHEVRPDLTGPKLLLAKAIFPDTVALVFNETLSHELPWQTSFTFSPAREITAIAFSQARNSILLKINTAFVAGQPLSVVVDNVFDCAGNVVLDDFREASVVVPEPADSLDVVINEVLFNPVSNGVDFVEVFNRSEKFLDLSGWGIGNYGDNGIVNLEPIDAEMLILPPSEYAVFTVHPQQLLSDYPSAKVERIFENKTPSLNDDDGSVGLVDAEGKVIDVMRYSDEMHSIFLKDSEGVSLERISANEPAMNADNWKSAASETGFATPGYQNSNVRHEATSQEDITLIPEIFAPFSAGQDFTTIEYNFDQGGFMGTISIHDARGRCIKTITENALLGTSGFFRWDGDRDDGTKAAVGNYMVRVQVFNSHGVVKVIRKRVAVAAGF